MLQVQADSGLYTDCITSTSFSTATDTDKHPVWVFFIDLDSSKYSIYTAQGLGELFSTGQE